MDAQIPALVPSTEGLAIIATSWGASLTKVNILEKNLEKAQAEFETFRGQLVTQDTAKAQSQEHLAALQHKDETTGARLRDAEEGLERAKTTYMNVQGQACLYFELS
ncbi:hypothetical protein H0H87_003797 [Tephrocybe sp. NHM501043]|nr:hypothetical protein H0H87_003797 [Tephrocybe sp. NHM501043]